MELQEIMIKLDEVTHKHLKLLEEKIDDLDNKVTDRHILTNDRINEAFDIIKMLERKIG